jgi:hypothetical protein
LREEREEYGESLGESEWCREIYKWREREIYVNRDRRGRSGGEIEGNMERVEEEGGERGR